MKNATAIITGGAQGIGKGIALHFLSKNINVVIADKDKEAGEEFEEEQNSGLLKFIPADTTDENQVISLVKETVARNGSLNFLINNCGISEFSPLSETTLDDWNRIISTNLTSYFLTAKHTAAFLKHSRGRIVNIASTRGIMSEPGNEAYAASKGGVIALTHALANSLSPEVMVNSISPGWIDVSNWKKKSLSRQADLSEDDNTQHLAGRVGTPEDIAQLAWFLCAEQNGFITGQNFIADGGMLKKMIYV